MREFGFFCFGLIVGLSVLGIGYYFGRADMLKKIMDYYSIRHAANPMEGQDLIRFLQK